MAMSPGHSDGKNYVGIFHARDGDAQRTGTFVYTRVDDRLEGSIKAIGGEETKSVLTRQ